jgi:GTPase SAR1 family protein
MPLDKITKQQILLEINEIPMDQLISFIEEGEPTKQEMIDAGLHRGTVVAIEKTLADKVQDIQDGVKALELCKEIECDIYDVEEIRDFLNEGRVNEEQLLEHTTLNRDMINNIRSYHKSDTNFPAWDNLPPLEKDRTDIYFFGMPGSGKSCILASLFSYLHNRGMMETSVSNTVGLEYRNQLINELSSGILPHSTVSDKVVYVPLDLRNLDNMKKHPLNFIEMSGEMFKNAAASGFNTNDLRRLRNYLDNENKKIIFFALDYFQHTNGNSPRTLQQINVSDILQWLDDAGVLKNTDAVYVLLTKADLFPPGQDRTNYASAFLKEKYLNFIHNCIDKEDKYPNQFKCILFPYSIGKVRSKNLLTEPDEDSPTLIVEAIKAHTFHKRHPSWKRYLGIS